MAAGAEKETDAVINDKPSSDEDVATTEHVNDVLTRTDSYLDEQHVRLGWRTWLVVFMMIFGNLTQVFVVTAAGQVIAFIVRDLGNPGLAGWIIQGPLVMQSALSPIVGRLSDVFDRKWVLSVPYIFSFVGACISARANDMNTLIGGGILIGICLATLPLLLAIPSEILPMKYRPISGGIAFFGGACGGLIGILGAGGVTNQSVHGWRNIFWLQAAFHGVTFIGLVLFYNPIRRSEYPKLSFKGYIWSLDPIGSALFVSGITLILLGLDWTSGSYPWKSAHVIAPLCLGIILIVIFGLYEWKCRTDGLVAHAFFKHGRNFALGLFGFAVEGWMFYSAVNSVTPQLVLNLGWETTAWDNATRQMTYQMPAIIGSWIISAYATKYKELKYPLVICFTLFLVSSIFYATISPTENHAQMGINVLTGFGQAGPLTLITPIIQYSSPHALLATASGLAAVARAVGGAFGSAVLDAIANGHLGSTLDPAVGSAATKAGLPASSVPALMAAFAAGTGFDSIPGMNSTILEAASDASHWAYAHAYRLAWSSVIPFVALAIIGILCLKDVKEMMTEHIEASVEPDAPQQEANHEANHEV